MALVVMMLVGVQAYAQPRPRYHHHPAPHRYYRPAYRPYYRMPSYYYYHPSGYYYYTPLRVYWWGSAWNRPNTIKIENLEFKRTASGRLRIINGSAPKVYLSMYDNNSYRYTCPSGTIIDVTTGGGRTKINVYDNNGNSATYTL